MRFISYVVALFDLGFDLRIYFTNRASTLKALYVSGGKQRKCKKNRIANSFFCFFSRGAVLFICHNDNFCHHIMKSVAVALRQVLRYSLHRNGANAINRVLILWQAYHMLHM